MRAPQNVMRRTYIPAFSIALSLATTLAAGCSSPTSHVDRCGDSTCRGDEDCVTCPDDCGVCAGCGDLACVGVETCTTCSGDCGACVPGQPIPWLSIPSSGFIDEPQMIDARGSTDVCALPQADGTPSVVIDFGDGDSQELLAGGHLWRTAGIKTVTLTVKSCSGVTASTTAQITIRAIPDATGLNTQDAVGQNLIDMTNAAGNPAYYIAPSSYGDGAGNRLRLQAAIDHAAAHNDAAEQEIIVPANAEIHGDIRLVAVAGNRYITIRSSALGELPHLRRVAPSDSALMPHIRAQLAGNYSARTITSAPGTADQVRYYRLQGLHLAKDAESNPSQMLVVLGENIGNSGFGDQGGDPIVSTHDRMPNHFILDRAFVDGGASPLSESHGGVRIFASHVAIVDSYLAEFKIQAGIDSVAVTVSIGSGPYAFQNNVFVASSENFFFGGGGAALYNEATVSNATTSSATLSNVTNLLVDENIGFVVGGGFTVASSTIVRSISGHDITFDPIPAAPDPGSTANWTRVPSYVELRRNYLFKPTSWFPRHPSWNGVTYQVKNLWESKVGRYQVLDANWFEGMWVADQAYALQISPRNVTGTYTTSGVLRDVQISNNVIRNASHGLRITASDYADGYPSQLTTDVVVRNNLWWNVGNNWDGAGAGHEFLGTGNPYNVRMKRVFVIHNTDDNGTPTSSGRAISAFTEPAASAGFDDGRWSDNLHQDGGYGFFSQIGPSATINWPLYFPPGDATNTNRNHVINLNGHAYPPWTITQDGVSYPAQFVDYANGDLTLVEGNPGKAAASDGLDTGADIPTLRSKLGCSTSALATASCRVRTGDWTP